MTAPDETSTDTHWNETTHGIVSVLLVAHLFALALIWIANNEYGSDDESKFIPQVKRFANPYLFAFWLDRAWDQKLTTGEDLDADHRLRLLAANREGQSKVVEFPNAESTTPEMRERWQEAARGFARLTATGGEAGADRRALALGKAWLGQERAEGRNWDTLTIQGMRRNRVTIEQPERDPLSDTLTTTMIGENNRPTPIFAVKISWPNGEGEASLSHLGGDARDQAPVVPGPKPATSTTPVEPAAKTQALTDSVGPASSTSSNARTPAPTPENSESPAPAPMPVAPPKIP